jgi:putative SOS response-associated peptidase YedK
MCARFQFAPPEDWIEEFGLADAPEVTPHYNIAPSQDVLAVRRDRTGRRQARLFRWGLVPYWADDPAVGSRLINARAESVATRPAFRDAFRQRRCLVPAQGFYEWKKFGRAREPWLVRLKEGRTFAFAGLWDRWTGGPASPSTGGDAARGRADAIESCALITTSANTLVAPIHGRMPVLLDRSGYEAWLDPDATEDDLKALLRPFPPEAMEAFPVSARVNSTAADDPDLTRPVAPEPDPGQKSLF